MVDPRLEDVPGAGAATVRLLATVGITTVRGLAAASAVELASLPRLRRARSEALIAAAGALLAAAEVPGPRVSAAAGPAAGRGAKKAAKAARKVAKAVKKATKKATKKAAKKAAKDTKKTTKAGKKAAKAAAKAGKPGRTKVAKGAKRATKAAKA